MKLKTILFALFALTIIAATILTLTSESSPKSIDKPPFIEPQISYKQKKSIIQMPIVVKTENIKKVILKNIETPLSSGVLTKVSADIFATETITRAELIKTLIAPAKPGYYRSIYKETKEDLKNIIQEPVKLWVKPVEATYKFVSKDVTSMIDKLFKLQIDIKHEIFLKDLQIVFSGNTVEIFTSYKINLSTDYEQALIPLGPKVKIKGVLQGEVDANLHVSGKIFINNQSELVIDIPTDGAQVEFTKVNLPTAIKAFDFLKFVKTQTYLADKLLTKELNKSLKRQLNKQIAKQQVTLKLKQKIQNVAAKHSQPIYISKDLWLIPQMEKISLSQPYGQGKGRDNGLSLNIGLTAKPIFVSTTTEPKIKHTNMLPVSTENFKPAVHLYPNILLQYTHLQKVIEKELQEFINKEYKDVDYSVANVTLYPSKEKLVLSIDLIDKKDKEKVLTFYLWGTPHLNSKTQEISLQNLDYTLSSKNTLLEVASWIVDDKVKNFIHEASIFSYKKKLDKLYTKLSNIKKETRNGVFNANINSIEAHKISTSKDALVIYLEATGSISYVVKLKEK